MKIAVVRGLSSLVLTQRERGREGGRGHWPLTIHYQQWPGKVWQVDAISAVEAGAARVVGTDPQRILAEAERLLDDPTAHAAITCAVNPYGDGHAAERIVDALLEFV